MFAGLETWLVLLLQVGLTLIGAVVAYGAVRNARTPQGAVAWVVFLVSFPLLALPAYAIFGRLGFGSYIRRRKAVEEAHRRDITGSTDPERWSKLRALDALSPMAVTVGDRIELMTDGAALFDAIMEAIDAAETEVLVQYFIIRRDPVGRRLQERLIEAARRGVRVRLMCDALGSIWLGPWYLRALREAGAQAAVIKGPQRPLGRVGLNFRNHRKAVIVDGRLAFTGGHNLGQEYVDGGRRFEAWRDTSIRIEGPTAWHLRELYGEDWAWAAGAPLGQPDDLVRPKEGEGLPALLMPTGPTDEMERASLMLMWLIGSARERLWIATPYLVPHTDVLSALQLAAWRGVDVRILIPAKPDKWLPWLAARAFFEDLTLSGVQIWEYERGFMHQKVMLVDDDLACVGTLNLDVRSVMLNFEATVAVQDEAFAGEVAAVLERDFASSRRLDGDLSRAPLPVRGLAPIARLFGPVL